MSEIASPKPSVIERLCIASRNCRWRANAAQAQLRELATILREMPEELVIAVADAPVGDDPNSYQKAAIRAVAYWLEKEAESQ